MTGECPEIHSTQQNHQVVVLVVSVDESLGPLGQLDVVRGLQLCGDGVWFNRDERGKVNHALDVDKLDILLMAVPSCSVDHQKKDFRLIRYGGLIDAIAVCLMEG